MWKMILSAVVAGHLVLGNGSFTTYQPSDSSITYQSSFPAQNVSSNQEIKWTKPRNLNGSYDVMLVIFFRNLSEEGKVIISVGNGDIPRESYATSIETLNDLKESMLHQSIRIEPGDDVKIVYRGDDNFLIKSMPHSYIMLTKTDD